MHPIATSLYLKEAATPLVSASFQEANSALNFWGGWGEEECEGIFSHFLSVYKIIFLCKKMSVLFIIADIAKYSVDHLTRPLL